MPIENSFQHDEMSRKNPGERFTVREVTPTALSESSSGQDAMTALGKRLSQTGVRVIVLLHGSIMGDRSSLGYNGWMIWAASSVATRGAWRASMPYWP